MNSWNPSVVSTLYSKQAHGFITNVSGRIRLQPPVVANNYRKVSSDSPEASEKEVLSQAVAMSKAQIADKAKPPFPYTKPAFGYVLQWLSELGRTTELDGLLAYADDHLDPTWENGGLYYPRNDTPFVFSDDDEGVKWTHMDPFTGNAAIGYARLNVHNGQRIMYEKPWTRESLRSTPWIDNLDFVHPQNGAGVLRGTWDDDAHALILTVKAWDHEGRGCPNAVTINPIARGLGQGTWAAYVNGKLLEARDLEDSEKKGFEVSVDVKKGEEVDVVYLQIGGAHVNGTANGKV